MWLTDVHQAVIKNCCPSNLELHGQIVSKALIKMACQRNYGGRQLFDIADFFLRAPLSEDVVCDI
jgi:hypothetical protein